MSPKFGFFLGIIPGAVFIIYNYVIIWRKYAGVRKLALAEGQDWDLNIDFRQKLDAFKNKRSIFRVGESEMLRKEKELFLLDYNRSIFRHIVGGVILVIGAFLGPFSTLFLS